MCLYVCIVQMYVCMWLVHVRCTYVRMYCGNAPLVFCPSTFVAFLLILFHVNVFSTCSIRKEVSSVAIVM